MSSDPQRSGTMTRNQPSLTAWSTNLPRTTSIEGRERILTTMNSHVRKRRKWQVHYCTQMILIWVNLEFFIEQDTEISMYMLLLENYLNWTLQRVLGASEEGRAIINQYSSTGHQDGLLTMYQCEISLGVWHEWMPPVNPHGGSDLNQSVVTILNTFFWKETCCKFAEIFSLQLT